MAKYSPLVVLSGDENVGDSTGTTVTEEEVLRAECREKEKKLCCVLSAGKNRDDRDGVTA